MDIQQPGKTYQQGHSIIYSCQYHVVFCPKYRRKVLTGEIDPRLKELILEKQDDYGYKIIDMEVMPDHVHLLIDVDPRMGIVKIVGQIKGYTAHRNFCS
jgi:putative transposase